MSEANAFDFERQGQLAALAPLTRLRRPLPQGEAKKLWLELTVLHSRSRTMTHAEALEIVQQYKRGYFLMDNGDGLRWYSSRVHALIPLDDRFHIPKSLRRALNNPAFETRINTAFERVVDGCAARDETWITDELKTVYLELHGFGIAHSFETWIEGELGGAMLGLTIGGAFIGESMFYRVPDASKVAFARLKTHLETRGFALFDAQIMNPHLQRFGAYELPEREFKKLLSAASQLEVSFA